MSLNAMVQRMLLEIPGLASSYAKTLIQESQGYIQDSQMWSWQLGTSGWLTPGLLFPGGPGVSTGTVTVVPFTNTVIADAAATAAWAAYMGRPLLTECQFRSPFYSLYSIIGYDTTTNAPFATLTLDRPWMEPAGVGRSYMIYQAYFPAPVSDFQRFLNARDTTNNAVMDYWTKSQKDLAFEDPERTIFDLPNYIVPYQVDRRPGSSTYGNMLYELWPHPLSQLPYTYMFLRRGELVSQPDDILPYPLTEEVVLWRAKTAGYLWKEAQKGEDMQRGAGADWHFLSQAADEEYTELLKPIKRVDRDLVDLYFTRMHQAYGLSFNGYANINGSLNVGRF